MVYNNESRIGLKHKNWSQDTMDQALNAVRSGLMGVTEASRQFDIPRNTISDRLKNKTQDKCRIGRRTALTPQQEDDLCQFVDYMAGRGFPLTINQVLGYAWCIDKLSGSQVFGVNGPSQKWWANFKKRHINDIRLRRADRLDRGRALFSTVTIISDYFKLLKQTLDEGGFENRPQDIYNCDETIVDLNKCTQKVIIPRRLRSAHTRDVASSEHISINCCVSASGNAIPPMLIFKQSFPGGNYTRGGPDGTLYAKQQSGFMDSDLFLVWFEKLFLVHAKPSAERSVLLLLDGHISHCSPPLIESAIRNNVILLALPPHTTHICQPLDVAVYKSFKSHLSKLINLGKMLRGNFWIGKKDVASVIRCPFEESMTITNIKSGFRKCGIYPYDPNNIDKTQLLRNQIIPNIDVDLTNPTAPKFKDVETQTEPMHINELPGHVIFNSAQNLEMTAMEVSHNQDSSARPDRDIINTEVSSDYILLNNDEVNLEIASTCNLNYEDKSFKIHALEELNVCDDDFIHTQKSHRTYMDLSNINETQRQVHEETSEEIYLDVQSQPSNFVDNQTVDDKTPPYQQTSTDLGSHRLLDNTSIDDEQYPPLVREGAFCIPKRVSADVQVSTSLCRSQSIDDPRLPLEYNQLPINDYDSQLHVNDHSMPVNNPPLSVNDVQSVNNSPLVVFNDLPMTDNNILHVTMLPETNGALSSAGDSQFTPSISNHTTPSTSMVVTSDSQCISPILSPGSSSTSPEISKNPLFRCGIISEETAMILMPPPEEIPQGRKRPLRIKSSARVMTSQEVLDDLQNQKKDLVNKNNKKRKNNVTYTKNGPKTSKKVKTKDNKSVTRNLSKEDHHCHVCQENWNEETDVDKAKWVGCETQNCPKWVCPRCLPPNFDYKNDYLCDDCSI